MSKQGMHARPYKKLTFNKFYWAFTLVFIIAVISLTGGIAHMYMNSTKWKESPDSKVQLAKQSIDMLYDKDQTSRENKLKFINLYHKLIAKDGNLTKSAKPETLKKLKYYYTHLNSKGSATNYKKMYSEVALKYSILEQFDNLFTDDSQTILDKHVTPTTISNLNNSTFNDLTSLFVQNPNDAFVAKIIALEKSLSRDLSTLDNIGQNFNEAYEFTSTTVSLKKGYHKDITALYRSDMASLHYDWDSTTYMQTINKMMAPIVKWTISKYAKYQDYLTDMQNKATSYQNWAEEKESFLAQVQATHQAAVDAKHQAEAVAKAQKEAREQAQREAEAQAKKEESAKTVPDFKGKMLADVKMWADENNVSLSTEYTTTNDSSLNGQVISTSPQADGKVYPGYSGDDTITVNIYRYSAPASSSSSSQSSSVSESSSSSESQSSSSESSSSAQNATESK